MSTHQRSPNFFVQASLIVNKNVMPDFTLVVVEYPLSADSSVELALGYVLHTTQTSEMHRFLNNQIG